MLSLLFADERTVVVNRDVGDADALRDARVLACVR
jgi:hypothetical protein